MMQKACKKPETNREILHHVSRLKVQAAMGGWGGLLKHVTGERVSGAEWSL